MPVAVTLNQIAGVLQIHKVNVSRRAISENWPYNESIGRGGRKRLYPITSLPISVQLALKKHFETSSAKAEGGTPLAGSDSVDSLVAIKAGTGEERLSVKAEQTARNRFDLVHAWHTERDRAKRNKQKISDALTKFLAAYNAGIQSPELIKTLGKVSRSTLERWRKQLEENNNDYRALAPSWGKKEGQTKLTQDEARLLFDQLGHENRIKISDAIRLTKHLLQKKNIPSPSSPATMRRAAERFRKQHFDLWTFYREGEKALLDKVLPYMERDDSLISVGDVLVADGHRCNFFVTHPFTGKQCRPLLVLFHDWRSRIPCGWAFAPEENVQVIAAALRHAIQRLGKTPKLCLMDNGKAFRAKVFNDKVDLTNAGLGGLFARLDIKPVYAAPYNARAKIVERFFRDFGDQFERYMPTFSGTSITDKPASLKRNETLMRALYANKRLEIPQVIAAMNSWMEFHALQPHPTIKDQSKGDVFQEGKGPGIDEARLHYLMLDGKIKRLHRNGIRFLNADYWHEELYGLRDEVVIRYDFNDISRLLVYRKNGEFICTAERQKAMHPMAAHLGDAKDVTELKYKLSQVKALKKKTTTLARQAIEMTGGMDPVNALPWDKVVEIAPSLPEAVGQIEAENEGAKMAKQIPEFTGKQIETNQQQPEPQENIEPMYATEVERFFALLERKELSPEDQEFVEEFSKTPMGQQVLQGQPIKAQQGGES